MFSESLSPLVGNLIVISLVGVTAIIIGQIAKYSILKSLDSSGDKTNPDSPDADVEKTLAKRSRIRRVFKIFNIAVGAVTAVTLLVFVLFMNNSGAEDESQINKIRQAPLPKNFQTPTTEEIDESNEKSVTKKAEVKKKEATEENKKAMNNAIDIFKKAK